MMRNWKWGAWAAGLALSGVMACGESGPQMIGMDPEPQVSETVVLYFDGRPEIFNIRDLAVSLALLINPSASTSQIQRVALEVFGLSLLSSDINGPTVISPLARYDLNGDGRLGTLEDFAVAVAVILGARTPTEVNQICDNLFEFFCIPSFNIATLSLPGILGATPFPSITPIQTPTGDPTPIPTGDPTTDPNPTPTGDPSPTPTPSFTPAPPTPVPLPAGTILVDGEGNCNLLDAIRAANTSAPVGGCAAGLPGSATILIAEDVDLPSTDTGTALPVITTPVTIDGQGATVTAPPNSRHFQVAPTGELELKNIRLTGGNVPDEDGGSIFNQGVVEIGPGTELSGNRAGRGGSIYNQGELILMGPGVSVDNNSANQGGGIFNDRNFAAAVDGVTTLKSGISIRNNSALKGGGIYNVGRGRGSEPSFSIVGPDIIIADNNVTNSFNSNGGGGGIYNEQFMVIRNRVILSGNKVQDDIEIAGGGAILNSGSEAVLLINTEVSITSNRAVGPRAEGGAILNAGGSLTLANDVRFTDNFATLRGGAISNRLGFLIGEGVVLTSNRITALNPGGPGGALFNNDTMRVTDSCILSNTPFEAFNSFATLLVATGNWWGSPGGPTTSSVTGSVDTTGFRTTPILGCGSVAP